MTELKEHILVRLLVDLEYAQGHKVPAGSEGFIVDVHSTPPGTPPAYAVEIKVLDEDGDQTNEIIVDATHEQLEPVEPMTTPKPRSSFLPPDSPGLLIAAIVGLSVFLVIVWAIYAHVEPKP